MEAAKTGVCGLAERKLLPVGTVIVSVHGELNNIDGEEVSTGPMAEGVIEAVLPRQETCYSVAFAKSGVSIFLTQAEVEDGEEYRIGRVSESLNA